ncbi:MAG: lytic transglycosylase domain-containing protein [Bdellovibrionota bacterium]
MYGYPNRLVITTVLYVVSGFFVFALHAHTLDAPTLVLKEQERFSAETVIKSNTKSKITAAQNMELAIKTHLLKNMKGFEPTKAARLSKLIYKLSKKHGFSPGLILSVIKIESNYLPWAVSPRGALGLMQIMPETGEWLVAKYGMKWQGPAMLFDEEVNVTLGIRYMAYLRDKYRGDLKKMLSAYNRGPARVDEEVAEGRFFTLGYYNKITEYLPRVALVEKRGL